LMFAVVLRPPGQVRTAARRSQEPETWPGLKVRAKPETAASRSISDPSVQ
jgi:hypothetical protein